MRFHPPLCSAILSVVVASLVVSGANAKTTRHERGAHATGCLTASGAQSFGASTLCPAVRFELNLGQEANEVRFASRGGGGSVFLTDRSIVFGVPHEPSDIVAVQQQATLTEPRTLKVDLVGSNCFARVVGLDPLPGVSNYFLGNDPAKWVTGVVGYSRVRVVDVYPGIDLVFHSRQGRLEYDFVVAPGADPNRIRLAVSGDTRLDIDARGDLLLQVGGAVVRHLAPRLSQMANGERQAIAGRFVRRNEREIGFALGAFDPAVALEIDPEVIYGTYLGGSGDDQGIRLKVAEDGSVYVAGTTASMNFPTADPFQGTRRGSKDGFIAKLNPDGSPAFVTYLGGTESSNGEEITDLAVDINGAPIVVGWTSATNFPVQNASQMTNRGGFADAFVTKLNSSGDALVYSTYLGGSDTDFGSAVDVNSTGMAFVGGITGSSNFPNQGGAQSGYGGGFRDGFLTVFGSDGGRIASTFVGGNGIDLVSSVLADDTKVIVGGQDGSTDFIPGPDQDHLAFVARIDYTGASASADARAPITLSFTQLIRYALDHPDCNGTYFIQQLVKLDSKFSLIQKYIIVCEFYEACMHGQAFETFEVDADTGDVTPKYFGPGETKTWRFINSQGGTDLIRTFQGAMGSQNALPAGPVESQNVIVERFDSETGATQQSVSFGGSGNDEPLGGDADADGNLYIVGRTNSPDFPTAGQVLQGQIGGGYDVFIVKITGLFAPDFSLSLAEPTLTVSKGQKGEIAVDVTRTGNFAGSVAVRVSDTAPFKVKITPALASTTGTRVTFKFKVKKKAAIGAYQITFTGKDAENRERSTTLTLVVQ